jgi:hypothetical protein
MRFIKGLLIFLILVVVSNSCLEPLQLSIIPSISFDSVAFRTPADSAQELDLTINFKDGDGDLGLTSNDVDDTQSKYANEYFFLTNGTKVFFLAGSTITNPAYNGTGYDTLISYATKRKAAGTPNDTLPHFVTPYSCTHWDVITDATSHKVVDTLYCQLNPNTYNVFVDIYVKQGDGSFSLFNWATQFVYPNCYVAGFDGRFPPLSSDPSKPAPLEGKIKYRMYSAAWTALFGAKTLELRVTIQDRALHKSNTITTPPFELTP